ncbi:hypothetical protein MBLNU457_1149t1 [Dothideomycetes sp. NU457]
MAHQKVIVSTINSYSPKETIELVSRAGVYKANMRIDKIFFSAFMAGALLAFAAAVSLITNTAPWYQENAPGLIKTVAAMVFPLGLVMIVLTGADLVTGTFMYTTVSCLHRRLSPLKMLMHWFICFWGNLAGSLFVAGILTGYGGAFSSAAYKAEVISFTTAKAVTPEWYQIFLRGIGCNWLVCLACFLAFSARETSSKIVAIWWPTFAFVCLGFDHVVANMFFIPTGIFYGNPKITVGYYIWKSMIPSLIGNIIGGGLFVGVMYWYLFLTGDNTPVVVDGDFFDVEDRIAYESHSSAVSTPTEVIQGVDGRHRGEKTAESMV